MKSSPLGRRLRELRSKIMKSGSLGSAGTRSKKKSPCDAAGGEKVR